jgi:hypothetical protein
MDTSISSIDINIFGFLGLVLGLTAITLVIVMGLRYQRNHTPRTFWGVIAVIAVVLAVAIIIAGFTKVSLAGTTAIPSSTPAPRMIQVNRTFSCITCPSQAIKVVLQTITLDPARQRMEWKFQFTNQGAPRDNDTFEKLILHGLSGHDHGTYIAYSTAAMDFGLATGQSAEWTVLFDLLPQPGAQYRLSTVFNTWTYQDESFTF